MIYAEEMQKTVESRGYQLISWINEHDKRGRFFVYKASKDAKDYLVKIASPGLHRELENEVWWHMTLNRLNEARPEMKLKAPSVVDVGSGWYVGEFFNNPQLVDDPADKDQAKKWTKRLATMLVDLDLVAISPQRSHDSITEASQSAPYNNLWKKVEGWLEAPSKEGLITVKRKELAKKLITDHLDYVLPTLQHGDFVPWHMFDLGEDVIGIIDGEHSSLTKPRYYDLAYLYTRLATRQQNMEQANALLRLFLHESRVDRSEFVKAWLPVITLRSLGMHADALADIGLVDYREQAVNLLDRCFSAELNSFLR